MIGKEILNYTILSLIGQGGMGSVYLGENKYIKEQKVAIKVINSNMVNDFTRKQLEEEAKRLAELNHPNIVRFYNYHIDEEGNVYLIMEYADGMPIDQYIRTVSGLIVEDRICPLFEPILDAVGYAHQHKIIHRDIKPSNIIITKEGIPKILDFGIATIIGKGEEEGLIMGTPSYMSPEQVKGQPLDARSDIYALGVLLFQMMTGNAPYDTTTLTAHEIDQKVVEEPLPRMRSYYKYISEKVQKIVDKATAKNPADRYQTCAEFKRDLHRAIYPPKIPRWAWAAAAALIAIIVGGSIYIWDYNRTKVSYYKDYAEVWGVPKGIHKLSSREQKQRVYSYKFVYRKHKLQRMSYVNSKGSVVKQDNTDDIDRPADALFFYQSDGKVDYVKVCDPSGKVLYVKDYSPDLKVATFKYDDEYGTERNLSVAASAFASAMADNSDGHSKISRYLLTYDDEGRVARLRYAGFQNVLVADNDGIFGKTYTYDDKNRATEETTIGYDGKPKGLKNGFAIRIREYDKEDNPIRYTYLTIDRKASGEKELDVPVCHNVVDKWGNVVRQQYEDLDGNLMLRTDIGIAGFEYTIEDGLQTMMTLIGLDGKRGYDRGNRVSGAKTTYDERGFLTSHTYIDANNEPMQASDGTYGYQCKCDEHGNAMWVASIDKNGKYIRGQAGYAIVRIKYDGHGNAIETSYYDEKDSLVNVDGNMAIFETAYDKMNRVVSQRNFDKDRQPAGNSNGVIAMKQDYSVQGNVVRVAYYDKTGKNLASSGEGIAGWNSKYDDFGNETRRDFFDTQNKPTLLKDGFAGWEAAYDDRGNQLDIHYFNKAGQLCLISEGYAGIKRVYDERGNILEEVDYGLDKQLANGRLLIRYKYDSHDNQTEYAVFDKNGNAVLNSSGIHRQVNKYNDRNQCVENICYGVDGKPKAVANDVYAMVKYKYNDMGDEIETSFFDVNGKPVCKKSEHYATHRSEYDNAGRVIRQTFFDEKGQPTDPAVMVPEGLCKYDQWGNMCYLASADGHGHLIFNTIGGFCIKRSTFDARGNVLEESYYDQHDKPMVNRQLGFFKSTAAYNKKGMQTLLAYSNVDGKPMDGKEGFSKIEVSYTDDTDLDERKYYDAGGQLLLVQKWNGSDWTNTGGALMQQQQNVSAPAATAGMQGDWMEKINEMSAELPYNFGEDADNLSAVSCRATGDRACEIVFKAPKSKYEMTDAEVATYTGYVEAIITKVMMPAMPGIRITGVLYDSKGRQLQIIRK